MEVCSPTRALLSNSQTLEAFRTAAVPPLPSEGLGGGRTSYIRKQGTGGGEALLSITGMLLHCTERRHSLEMALVPLALGSSASRMHQCTLARIHPFTGSGLGIGAAGAVICDLGGHLICLRCVDAQYGSGAPFISVCTGKPIHRADLFAKYEAFPAAMEVKPAGDV
jgi:hypothetical protein